MKDTKSTKFIITKSEPFVAFVISFEVGFEVA